MKMKTVSMGIAAMRIAQNFENGAETPELDSSQVLHAIAEAAETEKAEIAEDKKQDHTIDYTPEIVEIETDEGTVWVTYDLENWVQEYKNMWGTQTIEGQELTDSEIKDMAYEKVEASIAWIEEQSVDAVGEMIENN